MNPMIQLRPSRPKIVATALLLSGALGASLAQAAAPEPSEAGNGVAPPAQNLFVIEGGGRATL